MTNRTLTAIKVFWDKSDYQNEGWAFELTYDDDHLESGPCDEWDDIGDAVGEVITANGLALEFSDFDYVDREGGAAFWEKQTPVFSKA